MSCIVVMFLDDNCDYEVEFFNFLEVNDFVLLCVKWKCLILFISFGCFEELMIGEIFIVLGNFFGFENIVICGVVSVCD